MDREAFLAQVAARLDMPAPNALETIDELRGHLQDAVANRRDHGESAADAERHAVERIGDPDLLGRELTRAYRARRPLLAVVGGSVRAAASESLRAWMQVILVIVIAGSLGLAVASAVLHAIGRDYGSMLTGPALSAVAVALVWLGFAAVGWALPGRITDLSGRDHDTVRRVVAMTGLVVSSLALWLVLSFQLDAVTAIGLPLAPIVFALVALAVPAEPRIRIGVRETLAIGLLLVVPVAFLAIVTAHLAPERRMDRGPRLARHAAGGGRGSAWRTVQADWETGDGHEAVDVSMPEAAAGTLESLRVEVWPVVFEDGLMRFGPAPLATTVEPAAAETSLAYAAPSLRRPVDTVRVLVGVESDGTRVLLDQEPVARADPAVAGDARRLVVRPLTNGRLHPAPQSTKPGCWAKAPEAGSGGRGPRLGRPPAPDSADRDLRPGCPVGRMGLECTATESQP